MTIGPAIIEWMATRGISADTAIRMGVYSGRTVETGDGRRVEQDLRGNLIVFPYVEGGATVAEKYRTADKRFFQKPGGRKTFFNADILDDPQLSHGGAALVICEGEMDCLACLEAGYPYAVSVPDGAPPARDANGKLIAVPEDASDIDPDNDKKFAYVANNWARLAKIKRLVIATDNDEPGRRLAAELVRRLGRVRCYFVTFPAGCKDANDVLVKYGHAELSRVLHEAKPYPVSGVYLFSDLPQEPDLVPVSTGWERLDRYLKLYHPAFMVVTGRAGHGKTAWTQQLVAQLAARQGWVTAIASFEMRIKPFVADALGASYLGKARREWTEPDKSAAEAFINNQFCFLAPEPDCERVHDVDWLIEKAEAAVIRHGARVLLVDPWNEIEHARRAGESTTEYTNRALMALKAFGRRFDVLVIIVAHPTKSGASKEAEDLTLYDVSDSAAFQNKADLGVVIARLGDPTTDTTTGVFVKKIRYQPMAGELGSVELIFDKASRLFL